MEQFDLICIGGGSGGIAAARRAAQYGAKVALIEKNKLGGTCVNVGCVPKKLFYQAVSYKNIIDSAKEMGFDEVGSAKFNWSRFKQQSDNYIARLNQIYKDNLIKSGVTLIQGLAKFLSPNQIAVNGQTYTASHIILATGGKPIIPAINNANLGLTTDDFFNLTEAPANVAIVGGGYIACELSGVMQKLGSNCHLIVRKDRVLRQLDPEISQELQNQMIKDGVKLHLNQSIQQIEQKNNKIHITTDNNQEITVDCLIWATGRNPNIENLDLEKAGIEIKNGFIAIDQYQQTNIKGIYAIGDITNQPALTPVAIKAGRTLADRLFNNQPNAKLDTNNIPTVIFTHPPIAAIGLNEAQARNSFGDDIKVYHQQFTPMSQAFLLNKNKTIIRLICRASDEKILGLQMIGESSNEILQGFAVSIKMGAHKYDFDNTVAIHPTIAEELVTIK